MSTTERVIRDQFDYWSKAPVPERITASDTRHVIVGCGTSYHLAQSIAATFNLQGLQAQAVPGGEWARRRRAYQPDGYTTHVIALSRSGESTETIQALAASRAAGFATTAITCERGSGVTREADATIFAQTHPDEGIVMTASASLMLMTGMQMAGVAVGPEVAEDAAAAMSAMDQRLPEVLKGRSHFVFLGAGALYGIAAEGGIKVQEMTLSHTQAYHTMEYRHGPISLIDERSFVCLLYSDDTRNEEAQVAAELSAKGAVVIGLGGPGDVPIAVAGSTSVRPLAVLPALQILGERIAQMRGLDTSAPRHLSKVVVLS